MNTQFLDQFSVPMVFVLFAIVTLACFDRPQDGFLTVSQQALLDVQRWVGMPTP